MTRSRSNNRKKAAGVHIPSFNSRTSPAYYKSRDNYRKTKALGKLYPRNHAKRTALKKELITELGLPSDTVFIFRHNLVDPLEIAERGMITIKSGTVVVINKKNLALVLAVRITPFSEMDQELREKYDHSISTTFLHARARNQCKIHHSIPKKNPDINPDEHICGWMGCCGWRGGCEKDKSAGPYSLSLFTSSHPTRVQTDKERMEEFHRIRDFWATRFSTLSLFIFKSNIAIAFEAGVPGFHDLRWNDTPSGMVFATNLVVTCDGFYNNSHTDKDASRYGFGMFGLIDRNTGLPYDKEKGIIVGNESGVKLGEVKNSRFRLESVGIEIALDSCNGWYDMLWDVQIPHYTTESVAYDSEGKVIPHISSRVTAYGSSCQISKSLVDRIQILRDKKEGMSDSEWKKYCKSRVKSYEEEFNYKLKYASMTPAERREEAAKKRAAKSAEKDCKNLEKK